MGSKYLALDIFSTNFSVRLFGRFLGRLFCRISNRNQTLFQLTMVSKTTLASGLPVLKNKIALLPVRDDNRKSRL